MLFRSGRASSADVRIEAVEALPRGIGIALRENRDAVPVALPLLGGFNAWNAAGAYAAARALGIERAVAVAGLVVFMPLEYLWWRLIGYFGN